MQARFHGANMDITMQDKIVEALNNLNTATTSEKYVPTKLNSTIKQLAETDKFLSKKINTLIATNVCLTSNSGHH